MIFIVGTLVLAGGVGLKLSTPVPGTRTMAELRDAGITDGQRFVLTCPERLTPQTKRRINNGQPGLLRPKQTYGRVARTAVCFNPDGGNCFRPSDGLLRITDGEGEVIVPSLRRDLVGVDLDAGDDSDGGEDGVDDSLQYRLDDCTVTTCPNYDAGDGTNFCGRLNRLQLVTSPCMLPLCLTSDGGWDDELGEPGHEPAADCRFTGFLGTPDGGPRWRGCNAGPASMAVGSACVPVECGTLGGEDVAEEWRQ
jgi:hypothetical protein